MVTHKYKVRYTIPNVGTRQAVVEAPDELAARNMAEHMYGNVTYVMRDGTADQSRLVAPALDHDSYDSTQSLGRAFARQHLGLLGDSLSDRAISILTLLFLGAPVVGLWMGLPIYKGYLSAPSLGMPPMTVCVGVGLVTFCLGWSALYLCPLILLRIIGFAVYAGWVVFYLSGWTPDLDLFRSVLLKIVTVNSDAANLQKAGLLVAALAGFSVMGGLGKAVKGA